MEMISVNDSEREEWVRNDEGLYAWFQSWRRRRVGARGVRDFVREMRSELDACIEAVKSGAKQAHFLKYG